MKRIVTGIILTLLTLAVQAQTMTVKTQQGVSYLFTANGDDMTYTDNGQTLTIQGKSFSVGDIAGISIDESAVEANTVHICFRWNHFFVCGKTSYRFNCKATVVSMITLD